MNSALANAKLDKGEGASESMIAPGAQRFGERASVALSHRRGGFGRSLPLLAERDVSMLSVAGLALGGNSIEGALSVLGPILFGVRRVFRFDGFFQFLGC